MVYDDSLAAGWDNWSWNSDIDFDNASPVHSGAASLRVTYAGGWAGLSLRAPSPISTAGYDAIVFWIYGGSGGTQLRVITQATDTGDESDAYNVTAPAGAWSEVVVPLSALGSPAQIARINWQERTGAAQAAFYLDDIRLRSGATPPPPPSEAITLTVDATTGRHPISPYIYGMNWAGEALAQELALPVNRWGGNATTRYNYQTDISNHAMDWYFENIKESDAATPPADSAANRFIEQNQRTGTDTLLTLPISGYVANGVDRACGFSVQKYGAQTDTDPWQPDCGNGVRANGERITGNDPADTSIAAPPAFVAGWIDFLAQRYGPSNAGGVRFFNLDNEPDIWWETHRDALPVGWKYQEFRDLTFEFAAAIKQADPTALLLGPVVNGWTYYWYGAYDGQREDWATPDDRLANGDMDFVPWYLQQMKAYEDQHGTRLLDYLDLHYYPQGGVALTGAGNSAKQERRLRSTRSLWDANYVDESWIKDAGPDGGIVRLLPRMREWVAQYYPGTKLAITEYNWGALNHINGALAQADVLGIFGREGLDLATLWEPPKANEPGAFAFRMYRNYDGQGSQFGETSVHAGSTDQGKLAVYAAQRGSDGALTIMVINKSTSPIEGALKLNGTAESGYAQLYRYGVADLTQIERGADLSFDGSELVTTYPAQSISLLVITGEALALDQQLFLPAVQQ